MTGIFQKHFTQIAEVDGVPLPCNFLKLVGYEGKSSYVGLYWDASHELVYEDGVDSAAGMLRPNVYSLWLEHDSVSRFFVRHELGSDNAASRCMLIFNVSLNQVLIANIADGQAFLEAKARANNLKSYLASQIPQEILDRALAGRLQESEFLDVLQTIFCNENPLSISEKLRETRNAYEEMSKWLHQERLSLSASHRPHTWHTTLH